VTSDVSWTAVDPLGTPFSSIRVSQTGGFRRQFMIVLDATIVNVRVDSQALELFHQHPQGQVVGFTGPGRESFGID
jgi:hypothetical protein